MGFDFFLSLRSALHATASGFMSLTSPLITIMQRAAQKAAKGLMYDFGEIEQLQVSRKGPKDFASTADLKSEATLIEELRKARPDFGVLAEESAKEIKSKDGIHRWVIDPLDGTANFLHSIPHFCISIGLEEKTRNGAQVIAGVIFNPVTQDFFSAEKGKGAYLNGKRLKVSARKDMEEALIATGNSSFRPDKDQYHLVTTAVSDAVHSLRCSGSAALDLAYVAAGKYDAFWHRGLKRWDIAAGLLMVQESSGIVRDLFMKGNPLETGDVLACNSALSPKLDKLLAVAMKSL
jgi:myo-inositol-1(or 4)-monophosphatase